MSTSQPTVDELLGRMGRQLSEQLFPFVVVSIIHRAGGATRSEIAVGLDAAAGGQLDFSGRSLPHLLGRLEKTFGLIARVPDQAGVYMLTDKGAALYAATLAQVIDPLRGFLSEPQG